VKVPKATVRLAVVVQASGRPEPVTLWVDPRKDKAFQAAVAANRVLTVKQETVGGKKDFGVVGFHQEKNVSYWVFPKALDRFADKRVIGIDYGILKTPEEKSPPGFERRPKPRRAESPNPRPAKKEVHPKPPVLSRFRVTLRCVAMVDLAREVEAKNRNEAKEKALAETAGQAIDFSRATQTRKVVRIEPLRPASADHADRDSRRARGGSQSSAGEA
jgi:hypothetical protein